MANRPAPKAATTTEIGAMTAGPLLSLSPPVAVFIASFKEFKALDISAELVGRAVAKDESLAKALDGTSLG